MRFVRSILGNITTVLIALGLSIVVWAVATRSTDPIQTRNLEIDVQTVGKPADATIVGSPPSSAVVSLQGPESALDQITPADYQGIIDLSQVPYGDSTVDIGVEAQDEQKTRNIEIQNIFPANAQIRLEQVITRDIPIVLDVRGEVARGHRLGDYRVEPESVQITGSAQRVEQIAEGRVTMFIDNAREDITELRRPIFYDGQGNVISVVGLTVDPAEVETIIPIAELAGFAEKPITVDWEGEPAAGYRLLNVSSEPSTVQVTGAPSILEGLIVRTETVDISGLTESESRQVALDLPPGVSLVDVQPVLVSVEIEPILTSDVVQKPVEVRGLEQDLEAILDPEEVRIFLFGPLPVLDSLEDADVRVTVDLLGLEVGNHVVEPIVSVTANDVEVRSVQPPVVSVVITNAMTLTNPLEDIGFNQGPLLPGGRNRSAVASSCLPTTGGSSICLAPIEVRLVALVDRKELLP